jgi:hypothetical protein
MTEETNNPQDDADRVCTLYLENLTSLHLMDSLDSPEEVCQIPGYRSCCFTWRVIEYQRSITTAQAGSNPGPVFTDCNTILRSSNRPPRPTEEESTYEI